MRSATQVLSRSLPAIRRFAYDSPVSASRVKMVAKGRKPSSMAAGPQTVDTPTAPGSNSNFTGLPKDSSKIAITTPITSEQMQV